MSLFTLLLPPVPLHQLPLLQFHAQLLRVPPLTLGLTLAGLTLGLLTLRLLDGRHAPLLFRLAAVVTAALTLVCVAGLVAVYWPLAAATFAVLLLLLDEAIHLLAGTLQLVAGAGSDLGRDARRLLASLRKAPKTDAVSKAG